MSGAPTADGGAIHGERLINVIVVGAGPSGLLFAYKLKQSFRCFSMVVLEKSSEVAGTWGRPCYPGCASNLPSLNFAYTLEAKHGMSSTYASANETKDYFISFANQHRLSHYIRFGHRVVHAQWNDTLACWDVEVEHNVSEPVTKLRCGLLINACGSLNRLNFPHFADPSQFHGTLVHSARWKYDIELQGKTVALIGNGASGVQILPAIQPSVKHVTFFARSPSWLLPPLRSDAEQGCVTDEDSETSRAQYQAKREANESVINAYYSLYFRGSSSQTQALSRYNNAIKARLPSDLPKEKLFPTSNPNCRRIVAGKEFLDSLAAPNVTVVATGVASLTQDGCIGTDGVAYTGIDIVICATGYDTSWQIPPFKLLGRDGIDFQQQRGMQNEPRSYLGMATDGFPNYFTLLGAYSPTANGTILPAVEAQVDYILSLIDRYQTESNMHSLAPKPEAVDDFVAQWQMIMQKKPWLHWGGSAESAKGDEGVQMDGLGEDGRSHKPRMPYIWPGTTMHYLEAIKEVRYEDWDIRYKGNRFAFLGDGISQAEVDPRADLSWYIKENDQGGLASRWKRREAATTKAK